MKTHIKSSNFTDFSKQPWLQLIYYAVYLPWLHLTVDFITKLLLIVEKNKILVVCDQLSKIAYFVVMTEKTSAERLARLFKDNI